MKTKKSISFFISLSVIFCILYIILAIKPLGKEYQFTPEWKIDVASPNVKPLKDDSQLVYFKLGQTMGYFTEDGDVVNFITFPFKASISDYFYTSYTANNKSAKFYSPDAKQLGTIDILGFPMMDKDRIYVFLPGGNSFAVCNQDGTKKWEYSGFSPITAFDSSANGCVVGFADGNITEFDTNGNIIQSFEPGGSDNSVILGAAISNSGDYIATISGQNKQRFVLAQKRDNQTKIIFHKFIDSSHTHQELVAFSANDEYVFYNTKNILGVTNVNTLKNYQLKIQGHAISLKETDNCTFVLTKDKNKYKIYAIETPATLIGSFGFEANSAFIQTKGNELYVGKDSTISKILITKK
ncbi:MAG: WD40 repeat domain-containing protein [Treponema sp.]|jgi:WD40 repeat protein|nr:WD40 repeat domain-containing protein [Treponema sp.]